jgi:hypothetical protein
MVEISQPGMETINEQVSVVSYNTPTVSVRPWMMTWNKRKYLFTSCGLHYTTKRGNTLLHIFSVVTDSACFKLEFDTEYLTWTLLEVEHT